LPSEIIARLPTERGAAAELKKSPRSRSGISFGAGLMTQLHDDADSVISSGLVGKREEDLFIKGEETSPQSSAKSANHQSSDFTLSRMGLSSEEAEGLLLQHGYNEIIEKRTCAIVKLLKFFWGQPFMIEIAAIL
jgi:magnesium-transporting ATPase (P-type)